MGRSEEEQQDSNNGEAMRGSDPSGSNGAPVPSGYLLTRADRRRSARAIAKSLTKAPDQDPTIENERQKKAREFRNRYRTAGLPNAKKFRKRSRVARLTEELKFSHSFLHQAISAMKVWEPIIQQVANEENWILRTDDHTGEPEVIWNGDDTLIDNAQQALKILQPKEAAPSSYSMPVAILKGGSDVTNELPGQESEAATGSGGEEQANVAREAEKSPVEFFDGEPKESWRTEVAVELDHARANDGLISVKVSSD